MFAHTQLEGFSGGPMEKIILHLPLLSNLIAPLSILIVHHDQNCPKNCHLGWGHAPRGVPPCARRVGPIATLWGSTSPDKWDRQKQKAICDSFVVGS